MSFLVQKKSFQKKKYAILQPVLSVFIVITVIFSSAPTAHAGVWGESLAAAKLKQMMEIIYRNIEGVLLGTLKVAATQIINTQINQLVGGGTTGQALFITDYESFLYEEPLQKTELYMNDFFTLTSRGKYASANYVGVGSLGGNIGGNYSSYLVNQAKNATINRAAQEIQMNLEEYTQSPDAMFAEGDWRAFNAFFSNPANNPYGYTLSAEEAYQEKLEQEIQIQTVKAQSSGYKPVEKGGEIITPSATIESIVADVQNMGNNIITNATNPAEFLSGVITGMVTRTVNGLIQRGIGQVQANIQREIGSVTNKVNTSLNSATQSLGPAAKFVPSVVQQTKINMKSAAQTPTTGYYDP